MTEHQRIHMGLMARGFDLADAPTGLYRHPNGNTVLLGKRNALILHVDGTMPRKGTFRDRYALASDGDMWFYNGIRPQSRQGKVGN